MTDLNNAAEATKSAESDVPKNDNGGGTNGINGDDSSQHSSADDSQQMSRYSSDNGSQSKSRAADLGEQELAAAKLSNQVRSFKIMVWIVLLLATIGMAIAVYVNTRRDEEATYEKVYEDHAAKILETFTRNLERKLGILDFLSASATMESVRRGTGVWPDFVFPNFEYRAANALELTDGAMIALVPLVADQEQRSRWEAFSVESTSSNDSWLLQAKLFQSSIRRLSEVEAIKCTTSDDHYPVSGRSLEGTEPVQYSSTGVPTSIYKLDGGGSSSSLRRVVDHSTEGPFLPIWQHYPLSQSLINFNLRADDVFRDECNAIIQKPQASVLGRIWYLQDSLDGSAFRETLSRWIDSQDDSRDVDSTPFSKIFYPVYDSDKNLAAILTSVIDWTVYLYDILPADSKGIHVVLQNGCGNTHTFQVDGRHSHSLGSKDLHDSKYNDMGQSRSLQSLLRTASVSNAHHVPLHDSFCPYTLSVFPSDDFREQFVTDNAIYYALSVIVIFGFAFVVFTMYDSYVERRQQVILKRAFQSRAIVSSLFPAAVQERLFRNGNNQSGTCNTSGGNNDNGDDNTYATTIFQWMPFWTKPKRRATIRRRASTTNGNNIGSGGYTNSGNGLPSSKNIRLTDALLNSESMDIIDGKTPIHELKPIADLFPHTTVLFADIAGFTRWSSNRKPEYVFTLLQTVYHAFDRIAKRRRVFKVETIGDCYVAVCGLPDPQPDHAVRMVKFASECRKKMTELVAKLKIGLGEDTMQLSMRFGLHSGPVTAGVLRGERSRFQLFGNTVNIAARMENTGVSNKIHATQETADLIAEAGNVHWVEQRVVDVVDRGGFQTYFIEPNNVTSGVSKTGTNAGLGQDESVQKNTRDKGKSPVSASLPSSTDEAKPRERRQISRESRRTQLDDKEKHLVEWNLDLFKKILQQIIAHRQASGSEPSKPGHELASLLMNGSNIRAQKSSVIDFPMYNRDESKAKVNPSSVQLNKTVESQLKDFISFIASMHRDNSFHNFTRSSNICVAVNKHLQRIVDDTLVQQLHEPLTKFAILFAALAHGIDHSGVPNEQLVKEETRIAALYKNKSVSQQNAIDLAFSALMEPDYAELHGAIFTNESDVDRFRRVVINCIIATDLYDRELVVDRNKRWLYAFLEQGSPYSGKDKQNLTATVVMEHVVQASHYGHALQYFLSYKLWNERYFREMYHAFKNRRMDEDPSIDWHAKELLFLDEIIIPLARKLKESKVLGTAGDDALTYALTNRKEWAAKGNTISAEFVERFQGSIKQQQKK